MKSTRFRTWLLALAAIALPALLLAAEGEAPKEHLGVADWIWKSLNLVVFVGGILWLAGGPIAAFLRKRKEEIAFALDEAAKKREMAARSEVEILRKIAELEAEVAELARKAKEDGERERAELEARGKVEAEKLLAQAREEVVSQGAAARRDLATYASELAVDLAAERIGRTLGDADRRSFVDRAIDEIGKVEVER
jgi:F-type H+-transporting ATPase subunit b